MGAQTGCLKISIESNVFSKVLSPGKYRIGRDKVNEISCVSPQVSRVHALIQFKRGSWTIEDLGSENGTCVNGSKIVVPMILNYGDVIHIGDVKCVWVVPPTFESKIFTLEKIQILGVVFIVLIGLNSTFILFNRHQSPIKEITPSPSYQNHTGQANPGNPNFVSKKSLTTQEQAQNPSTSSTSFPDQMVLDSSLAASSDHIERKIRTFLRKTSDDAQTYFVPPDVLQLVGDETLKLKNNPLRQTRQIQIQTALNKISGEQNKLPSALILSAVVAYCDFFEIPDQQLKETAEKISAQLLILSRKMGNETADKTLLLVSALYFGTDEAAWSRWYSNLQRYVKDPQRDRSVWVLHKNGQLNNEMRRFVIIFLTYGTILF